MAHKSLTKAIAKSLQAGNICYVHRQSREIIAVADIEEGVEVSTDQQAQIERLEANIKKYYKVPKMSAEEEIHVMHDFAKEDVAHTVRKELVNALRRTNPKRNFLRIVENQEDLYEFWLVFQAKWYQEWVRGYLLDVYRY
ncbi:MAG: UPF0158 family protein [Bacteroidota bacterium]